MKNIFGTEIRKTVVLLLMMTALTVGVSAGGKQDGAPPKLTKIRIATGTISFEIIAAKEKGLFAEEFTKDGIELVHRTFVNGPPMVEAFAAGEVDTAIFGVQPLLQGRANGLKFKALASYNITNDAFKLLAGPKSGVKKTADLKGKTVAVAVGTNDHQALYEIFQKAGVDEKDVNLVPLRATEAVVALQSGSIDGALTYGPQVVRLQNSGAFIIPDSIGGYGYIPNMVIGGDEFVKTYPDIAARLLKVIKKSVDWSNDNPDESIKLVSESNGLSFEDNKLSYYERRRTISINDEYLKNPILRSIDFLNAHKLLKSQISINDVLDTSVYKNAKLE
jgi:aliphatic sulfonates family ABC transporter substrate-binding protein